LGERSEAIVIDDRFRGRGRNDPRKMEAALGFHEPPLSAPTMAVTPASSQAAISSDPPVGAAKGNSRSPSSTRAVTSPEKSATAKTMSDALASSRAGHGAVPANAESATTAPACRMRN